MDKDQFPPNNIRPEPYENLLSLSNKLRPVSYFKHTVRYPFETFFILLIGFFLTSPGCALFGQNPNVPDGYSLEYEEDFSKASSINSFVFSSPEDWRRKQIDNKYVLEQNKLGEKYNPPHRSPTNIGLIRTKKFGSFVLDVQIQQFGRKYNHRDACVFFNVVDPANYYYAHIGQKQDQHSHQIMNVDDAPRTPITEESTDGHDWGDRDQWHHVRVIRNSQDGTIKIFVNDMEHPAMVARDTTHKWGYIGFGSFDDQARFRNIRVYAPEVREEAADDSFFTLEDK